MGRKDGRKDLDALRDRFIRETEQYLTTNANNPKAAWARRELKRSPELKVMTEDHVDDNAADGDAAPATIPIHLRHDVLGDLEIAIRAYAGSVHISISPRSEHRNTG